jgi:hypothetical protein
MNELIKRVIGVEMVKWSQEKLLKLQVQLLSVEVW